MIDNEKLKEVQRKLGVEADGKFGKDTLNAMAEKLGITRIEKKSKWPDGDYDSMVSFYGEVGTNQVVMELPYPMKLAWNNETEITKISCHRKCKDAFYNIFKKTLDHYGLERIQELRLDQFGGCLNVRKMRGGDSWSKHAWGCAIDIDPENNQLKWGKDKAWLAREEYEPFWKIVESEGGYSLGRKKNFDWMHFQFTNTP